MTNSQIFWDTVDLAPWKKSSAAELPTGEKGTVFALRNSTRRVGNNKLSPKRVKEGGVEGLRHRPPPGAAPRLSLEQRAQLLELLSQGAEALGFQGEVWTQPRVATLIRTGLESHTTHPRWAAA